MLQSALRPLPAALQALLSPLRVGSSAAIPTGIAVLDAALSDGGVPNGRLTEIAGARGSGRTTLVRHLVLTTVGARRWVAIVDGSRTLAPREWAEAGDSGRLWVVRPHTADRSAWCADILLRSGAFSLVVLDGAPALPRQVAVRLTRLAKEHDVALVVVGDSSVTGSAVRLRVKRATGNGQRAAGNAHDSRFTIHDSRVSVLIEKGGVQHAVEVSCAIEMARRLRAHPEVPDRRGVAKRNRWGKRIEGRGQRAEGNDAESSGAAPRKRRFAEPVVARDEFLLPGQRTTDNGQHRRGNRSRVSGP